MPWFWYLDLLRFLAILIGVPLLAWLLWLILDWLEKQGADRRARMQQDQFDAVDRQREQAIRDAAAEDGRADPKSDE